MSEIIGKPTKCSKDTKGCFCQWGSKTKYYYKCGDKSARTRARAKADKQGRAAHAGGYKGATEECQERGRVYPYKTGFRGKA